MISMVKAGASYNLKESKDEFDSDNKFKCITLTSKQAEDFWRWPKVRDCVSHLICQASTNLEIYQYTKLLSFNFGKHTFEKSAKLHVSKMLNSDGADKIKCIVCVFTPYCGHVVIVQQALEFTFTALLPFGWLECGCWRYTIMTECMLLSPTLWLPLPCCCDPTFVFSY